ncbi:MAG: mannose-1-phosphate guanylyltransferase [Planctomycetota bacterium]|nr:mannose-1-phosphate guanylyltransferase [Planctomycetota bacterium]
MMGSLHAVIMAGGSGTRFWPASRQSRPKQLLPLCDGEPMIRAAVARVSSCCSPAHTWIVTHEAQRAATLALLPDFPKEQVILEPEARDTAPCVALAVAAISARDPDATIVVLPADHAIEPVSEVARMLERAAGIAADGQTIVTFGVPPSYPATGYGYIELGQARDAAAPRAFAVTQFREKPDLATAERFVREARHWWNTGIIVFQARAMLEQMRRHCPELAAATEGMARASASGDADALATAFRAAPKTSIDFAVMEKADALAVVECTASWDDVGGFAALTRVLDADDQGNHRSLHGEAAAQLVESEGNVVYAEGPRTVTLFGVEGLVVAAVGDAVLVCPKDRAEELKKVVEQLRATGREDLL